MAAQPPKNNANTNLPEPEKVLRFTKGERISHWVHAVSFFILLFTGLGIIFIGLRPALTIFGGIQAARLVHRAVGVIFFVVVASMFIFGNTKYHWGWLKSIFKFSKSDIQHISAFPKEFFGGHGNYPPQGKYNGGEKINSLITFFGSILVTISGFALWFKAYLPAELARWAYPFHDLSVFIMTAAVIGHMYLGLLHPESRAALPGMLTGYVSSKFAKAHHGAWYEEIKKNHVQEGKNTDVKTTTTGV